MTFSFGGRENIQTIITGNVIASNGEWGINASANKMIVTGNNVLNNTSGQINLTGANNVLDHNITT